MFDELVEALRLCVKYGKADDALANAGQAANAIAGLSIAAEVNAKRAMAWAAEAEKARHWIPVTETKKPKAYEPVMVVYIGWNDALPHRDCTAYWSEDEEVWRWAETNDKVKVPITHYMPLPPLP